MSAAKSVLIAPDSFKDALSAGEVCRAIAQGLRERNASIEAIEFPLADGGEGAYAVLAHHLGLTEVPAASVDPLFRSITARYGVATDNRLAVIEMAQTAGLQLLTTAERNPATTTTLGVGLLIADAIERGARHIILTIGGSATNDGGIGMAAALGWTFLDASGLQLEGIGANLSRIACIEPPTSQCNARFEVLCDVDNPLYGSAGAACVYASQKGADKRTVDELDVGLRHLADCVARQFTNAPSPNMPGAGAAGGLGYGAMAFLGARLVRGIDRILQLTHFDQALSKVDLVITGEGSLDAQTARGKLIDGVCRSATIQKIPVIALCGKVALTLQQSQALGLAAAYPINDGSGTLTERLANTAWDLTRTARTISLPD